MSLQPANKWNSYFQIMRYLIGLQSWRMGKKQLTISKNWSQIILSKKTISPLHSLYASFYSTSTSQGLMVWQFSKESKKCSGSTIFRKGTIVNKASLANWCDLLYVTLHRWTRKLSTNSWQNKSMLNATSKSQSLWAK